MLHSQLMLNLKEEVLHLECGEKELQKNYVVMFKAFNKLIWGYSHLPASIIECT